MSNEQLKIHRTQELTIDHDGNRSTRVYQSIELTREAVEAGFLKSLPGSQLSVYLYLLTQIDHTFSITTSPTLMASLLPHTPAEVERALKMLSAQEYIALTEVGSGELSITLTRIPGMGTLTADPLALDMDFDPTAAAEPEQLQMRTQSDAISYILKQKAFSEEDLVRAIALMIPSQLLTANFRQEVDYWFKTFDIDVIKELIRRTDDARQRDLELNCQAYIRKIANEWIQEQIFSLADLENSDKLFRETRSLLEEFGLDRMKDTSRTHWETVASWINSESAEDFALSTEVARFAIRTAILRKADGRPSLTYVEENFIKPLKEAQTKTVEEARELFRERSSQSVPQSGKDKFAKTKAQESKTQWQSSIDFTRFREN